MNLAEVKEKIAKLLALAQSENANEASAALLAARRLMARFKLEESDIEKDKAKELRTVYYNVATFSSMRNSWFVDLAHVIAKHHCCAPVRQGARGSTVGNIGFVGLGDDADIACTIFEYAACHIMRWMEIERKRLGNLLWDKRTATALAKENTYNYAVGFVSGLKKQYEEQDIAESDETALVLVTPAQVTDYIESLKRTTLKVKAPKQNRDAMEKGYADGYKFSPTPQIKDQSKQNAPLQIEE